MPLKMDWIPEPADWTDTGGHNTNDETVKRLNDVVERATGKPMNDKDEIILEQKHLPYFEGASAGGLHIAGNVVRAIKAHGRIRLRFRRL